MTRPYILALFVVMMLFACKETPSPTERPVEDSTPGPAHSTPESRERDSLRMSPAQRELHKKDRERRKKGLDTLKPRTT